jgi:hypothetical protein
MLDGEIVCSAEDHGVCVWVVWVESFVCLRLDVVESVWMVAMCELVLVIL